MAGNNFVHGFILLETSYNFNEVTMDGFFDDLLDRFLVVHLEIEKVLEGLSPPSLSIGSLAGI